MILIILRIIIDPTLQPFLASFLISLFLLLLPPPTLSPFCLGQLILLSEVSGGGLVHVGSASKSRISNMIRRYLSPNARMLQCVRLVCPLSTLVDSS